MKLLVRVIEARNVPAKDQNGLGDPYVRLQLGKQKFRTKVVKKTTNPSWCEEFTFRVDDLKEKLIISVLDEDKYFNDELVGKLKIQISQVFDSNGNSLGTSWYTLQPKNNKKAKNKECGEILLTIYFSQNNPSMELQSVGSDHHHHHRHHHGAQLKRNADAPPPLASTRSSSRSLLRSTSWTRIDEPILPTKEDKLHSHTFAGRIAQIFNKNGDPLLLPSPGRDSGRDTSRDTDCSESAPESTKPNENKSEEQSSASFEELMKNMETKEQGSEVPNNLPGGVLVDQLYSVSPWEMNSAIFSPDLTLLKSLADLQGTTEMLVGPWKLEDGSVKRQLTYTKAATKIVKALKATEEQSYTKVNGKVISVISSVSTPDAPYGNCFRTEVLYVITPGPEQPSTSAPGGPEVSTVSRLVISWRMNFVQSTMMKGMIESGARQGIKDSFEQFMTLLAQHVKPLDVKDFASCDKEQVLASLQAEPPQSDWKLGLKYFANFTVISTVFMGLYVLAHIWRAMSFVIQGLEFEGLDLPDSIGEIVTSGFLVLQGQRVFELLSRFLHARVQRGSDHGVKAQGDGWLLTVALIEGSNLAAVDSSGFCDPYVVFTCNGKTRTSSIKFQKSNPQWNEIFEFDAMNEPPSMLDLEVFDFDGPFSETTSLGHAEINFVKTNITELADVWIQLQGKLAQACQSKLNLRVFLNNTRGTNVVKEYLTKMEKEVGKKIKLRSPQTNSAFQKLFGLPAEEFLINDFTCHLKRRMPLQGRLFLSARIIGYHADLFGHKTKFFFLWEDIEEIQVVPPTLSSMGSPVIVMTLRPSRGLDAKHGAKTQDADGRLKFHFQSFVSFNVANKTIMALWKARSLTPEQKVQIVEQESEAKSLHVVAEEESKNCHISEEEADTKNQTDDNGSFLGPEDINMSILYSSALSVPTSFLMELFSGSDLERRVMEKAGCLNYSYSPWEYEKDVLCERQTYYKFDKCISRYRGEVTTTQQKSRIPDRNVWLIEEVITLHGVPLGDFYNLHVRYQIEDLPSRSTGSNIQVSVGIAWLKSTKHRKRIAKNILSNLQERLKIMFSIVEKEFVSGK